MEIKIYVAGSISGKTPDEVAIYFNTMKQLFEGWGCTVFSPMTGKEHLRTESIYKPKDYQHPISTNRAIIGRDKWMVKNVDIVYMNLSNAETASIGCMMELAWAHDNDKLVFAVIPEDNIHQHAFVLQAADFVFDNEEDALLNLKELVTSLK